MQTEAKQKLISMYFTEPLNSAKEYLIALEDAGYTVSYRTVRRWVQHLHEMVQGASDAGVVSASEFHKEPVPYGTYVITGAQCNTSVHTGFLASLLWYCKSNDAKLIVPSIRYGVRSDANVWYDDKIKEFLLDFPIQFAPDLVLCSEANVPITAAAPLNGFASYVRKGSGIIPGTKTHMVSLPRLKQQDPRFLYSTGVCTLRNYPKTKLGRIADFHHMYAALVVNVTEYGWFVRQLVASDSGEFHDLNYRYTPTGRVRFDVSSITFGDLHSENISNTMLYTMCDIVDVLNPADVFCHDVLDFGVRSYHNVHNHEYLGALTFKHPEKLDLKNSLNAVVNVLNLLHERTNVSVIPSNHDDHLSKWLNAPWDQTDYINALLYFGLNSIKHKDLRDGIIRTDLERALKVFGCDDSIAFVSEDEACTKHGIEYSQHGHRGPNGSRGSPRAYRTIGSRVNIGHSHSAGIIDGVYSAGCMCSLDMGYNKGPTTWSHSLIVTYPDSKRSIITIRNEQYWR